MNKKMGIVIGLCVAIAAAFGVVIATQNPSETSPADDSGHAQINDGYNDFSDSDGDNEYDDNEPGFVDFTDEDEPVADESDSETTEPESEEATEEETEGEESSSDDQQDAEVADSLASSSFSVVRVVDSETGEELSPRVVFGSSYYDCYLSFGDDGSFDLYLDTATGMKDSGSYSVYGDTVYADYSGDRSSQYTVLTDVNGNVEYIIVPYAGYSVYFG